MKHRPFRAAAAFAFSLAVLAPSPSPAADTGEAAALLAKHQAYAGWSIGDGVVKTLRSKGRAVRNGATVGVFEQLRYGVAFRDDYRDKNRISQASGFTGNVFWVTNENGFTVRPIGEIVRYLADEQALFGERVTDATWTVVKHEPLDGADTALVLVKPQVGYPMNVWIDPATGAFKRVVIDPDGKYETAFNGLRYTEASGKRFLSAWHYGVSKTTYAYESVEVNPAVAPEELRPPKQTATWSFGDGTTPVELTKGTFPRILVDAVMNGVKGRFILDTGASSTVLVDSFARRIGAKRIGETRINGIGPGDAAAGIFTIGSIALGPSTLHDVIAVSGIDESWMRDEGVVGLIGFDLLGGAIVELDLDAGTLRIMDPQKVQPDQSQGFTVHADLSTLNMRVPMQLNGKYDVIATLDSGNPLNVLFSRDLINRDHLIFFSDPLALGATRLGGGVGGEEIEHCGRLSSLALGPIAYKPVPACDSGSMARNEILVGLDFMKAFNYVFDYPNGIVVMIPRKHP